MRLIFSLGSVRSSYRPHLSGFARLVAPSIAGLAALGICLAAAPRSAHATEPSQFLFVGDLNTGTLLRYNADPGASFLTPYGLNGNLTDPAYIVGQGVTEGVHGTGNTLITSQHLNGTWHPQPLQPLHRRVRRLCQYANLWRHRQPCPHERRYHGVCPRRIGQPFVAH